jgi:hypothetical protein
LFIEFTCTSCIMSLNHVSCVIDGSVMHDNNLLSAMRHAPRASRHASGVILQWRAGTGLLQAISYCT